MEENDGEIWLGENRFFLSKENILYKSLAGENYIKIANAIKEASSKIRSQVKGEVNTFVDLTEAEKSTLEIGEKFRELSEDEKTRKTAYFDIQSVVRVIVFFIKDVTNKKDMHVFMVYDNLVT